MLRRRSRKIKQKTTRKTDERKTEKETDKHEHKVFPTEFLFLKKSEAFKKEGKTAEKCKFFEKKNNKKEKTQRNNSHF